MVSGPVPHSLEALRRRFLMEEAPHVAEWLWGEHPQTAAFFLNWLGTEAVTRIYLRALPLPQQADVLCRISELEPDIQPNPLQEELLVDALRRISPTMREVSEDAAPETTPEYRGLTLVQRFLDTLPGEDFQRLIVELEGRDRNLARLCHTRYAAQESRGAGGERPNVFGLLNIYCDFISFHFNRFLGVRSIVYAEFVEPLSAEALERRILPGSLNFRFFDNEGAVPFCLQFTPRLLFHYLEPSFGAQRPYLLGSFDKLEFTPTERQVALSLAEMLGGFLAETLRLSGAALKPEPLPPGASLLDPEASREKPLLVAGLVVKLADTVAGRILVLLPPSPMTQTLLDTINPSPAPRVEVEVPGSAASPADPVRGNQPGTPPARAVADPSSTPATNAEGGEEDEEGFDDQALLNSNLEDLIWRDELDDANRAASLRTEVRTGAMDYLLRGFGPSEVESQALTQVVPPRELGAVHYSYGAQWFQHDLFAEAAEALEQALACDPANANARLLLAAAWGEEGLYFKEILAYRHLIAEEQGIPEVQVLLARRLSFLGRVEESFAVIQEGFSNGFDAHRIIENDPCFTALRRSVKWRNFVVSQSE